MTTTWRFKFAELFPADDPVGHFVIGLAAAANDLLLTNKILFPPDDPDREDQTAPERVALLRLAIGQVWETHLLVKAGAKIPAVDAFIGRFADAYPKGKLDGEALVRTLGGDAGATVPGTRHVLEVARNWTFHYPKPGAPELVEVLERIAADEEQGEVVFGEFMPSLRSTFADDVILRLSLTGSVGHDVDRLGELFKGVADTVVAVVHLAQIAIYLWAEDRGFEHVDISESND